MCAELRNSGGYALRHRICSERGCLTMKPCTKGQTTANVPAPAPPPRNGAAGRFGNITKHSGRRRNPTHSSQASPTAGERQLSERPCVGEVSFCQTTYIQTKPVTAGGSSPAVPQSVVPATGSSRKPKAQSKWKASQKALVKLVKLAFASLLTNGTPLRKSFSCAAAGVHYQSEGQGCRTGKGRTGSLLES